jgi:hypothetical protein
MHHAGTSVVAGALLALLGLLPGCTPQPARSKPGVTIVPETHTPPKAPPGPDPYKMTVEEVEHAPLARDIVAVHTHYNLFPWLQFDPTDPRPQGLVISALFLVSNKTGKGAFADGLITVKMYRVDRDEQRRETRTLVHTWDFTTQQALPYRAVKRTVIGQGYQLHLRWPKDMDLTRREIIVIVEFTRPDGAVIRGGTKFLKVPDRVDG